MGFLIAAVLTAAAAAPAPAPARPATASRPHTRALTDAEVREVAGQLHLEPEAIDSAQAFQIEADGQVTRFVALPNPQASTEYYLVRGGKAVAHISTANTVAYAFTQGLTAVSFEDITGDGRWDVAAVEHHDGAGGAREDGSRPPLIYDAPVLLVQQADGSFTDASARLNWSCARGKKPPVSLTVKDIRKAATCVSALTGRGGGGEVR